MPRQIHVTITREQKERCEHIAATQKPPTTWQQVARKFIDLGLTRDACRVFCRTCGQQVPDADESEIGGDLYVD